MITIKPFSIPNPAKGFSWAIRSNIINAVKVGMRDAEYISKVELLSGGGKAKNILNYRSGRLSRSVKGTGRGGPAGFIATGELRSDGVEYAGIHEEGGIIQHPGTEKLVKFYSKLYKKYVFSRGTEAHNINIKERSFLRRAIERNAANMESRIEWAIEVAIRDTK